MNSLLIILSYYRIFGLNWVYLQLRRCNQIIKYKYILLKSRDSFRALWRIYYPNMDNVWHLQIWARTFCSGATRVWGLKLETNLREVLQSQRSTFKFKTLLRHYAKQAITYHKSYGTGQLKKSMLILKPLHWRPNQSMVVYSRHSYLCSKYYIRKVGGIYLPQEISKLFTKSSSSCFVMP